MQPPTQTLLPKPSHPPHLRESPTWKMIYQFLKNPNSVELLHWVLQLIMRRRLHAFNRSLSNPERKSARGRRISWSLPNCQPVRRKAMDTLQRKQPQKYPYPIQRRAWPSPLRCHEDLKVELSRHLQCLDSSGSLRHNKGSTPRCYLFMRN
jgi:hypothetical protein